MQLLPQATNRCPVEQTGFRRIAQASWPQRVSELSGVLRALGMSLEGRFSPACLTKEPSPAATHPFSPASEHSLEKTAVLIRPLLQKVYVVYYKCRKYATIYWPPLITDISEYKFEAPCKEVWSRQIKLAHSVWHSVCSPNSFFQSILFFQMQFCWQCAGLFHVILAWAVYDHLCSFPVKERAHQGGSKDGSPSSNLKQKTKKKQFQRQFTLNPSGEQPFLHGEQYVPGFSRILELWHVKDRRTRDSRRDSGSQGRQIWV